MLRVPEAFDAAQAVVVSTWDGDGVLEHIQTDAAQKLILGQRKGHVPDWRRTLFYSHKR